MPNKDTSKHHPSEVWLGIFIFLAFFCPMLASEMDERYRSMFALAYVLVCFGGIALFLVARCRYYRAYPGSPGFRLPWEHAELSQRYTSWWWMSLVIFLVTLGVGLWLTLRR